MVQVRIPTNYWNYSTVYLLSVNALPLGGPSYDIMTYTLNPGRLCGP